MWMLLPMSKQMSGVSAICKPRCFSPCLPSCLHIAHAPGWYLQSVDKLALLCVWCEQQQLRCKPAYLTQISCMHSIMTCKRALCSGAAQLARPQFRLLLWVTSYLQSSDHVSPKAPASDMCVHCRGCALKLKRQSPGPAGLQQACWLGML